MRTGGCSVVGGVTPPGCRLPRCVSLEEAPPQRRRAKLVAAYPAPAIPAIATVRTFVVTHVRQALQQVVASGAFSLYLADACATRLVQIVFTTRSYAGSVARVWRGVSAPHSWRFLC